MKNFIIALVTTLAFIFTGCEFDKPKPHSTFVDIGPTETAFLIALDGNTMQNQKQLKSMEFLESKKVQVKRVEIPEKVVDVCPNCRESDNSKWKLMPTARLVVISHAPVTRQWTGVSNRGTSNANEAFHVESNESIDFSIDGNIQAHIPDTSATNFLYNFGATNLDKVMDVQIRPFMEQTAFRIFSSHSYEWATENKNFVTDSVLKVTREHFEPKGIHIDAFGFTGGITPSDEKIQQAINAKYEATKNAEASAYILKSQEAWKLQKEYELKAQSQKLFFDKWDGKLPQYMAGGANGLPLPTTVVH